MGEVACPRCGIMVDAQERRCTHCGVDLAVAAALAEHDLTSSLSIPGGAPIAPEILVPRLGESLIEKGLLTFDDLRKALEYQGRQPGSPRLIGQVLLELGMITRETLDQVITEQILNLQTALQQSNRQLEQRVHERTAELQRALSKLSELNQLKSNFISNISHELRTPLTHLRGYLTLLADGSLGEINETQEDACNVMLRAETRLEQLIDDLIQFSLATRGELTLHVAAISLPEIIQNTLNRAARLALARKITCKANLGENLPLVKADAEKISWVLLQLMDNAIKFTPQNGQVTLTAQQETQLVSVSVSDTGIGIPSDRLAEIFEPFHQLDGSETRKYGGVGLGLALVRRIMEAHGTTIHVNSQIGQGTRFEFCLPVANHHG